MAQLLILSKIAVQSDAARAPRPLIESPLVERAKSVYRAPMRDDDQRSCGFDYSILQTLTAHHKLRHLQLQAPSIAQWCRTAWFPHSSNELVKHGRMDCRPFLLVSICRGETEIRVVFHSRDAIVSSGCDMMTQATLCLCRLWEV